MKKLLWVMGLGLGVIGIIGGGCGWVGIKMAEGIVNNLPDEVEKYFPAVRWCGNGIPQLDRLPELLNNKTYMVMLGNNTELRPGGGFWGSYVALEFKKGGLDKMRIEDIYQPDGQLVGHVEPPYPIQEAFGQGWWKLRDANWDVDFASAAGATAWFMEHGGEKQVDGIVAVNLDLLKKWLAILGGVKTFSYDQEVNADNLYTLAQAQAESGGKRGYLGAVGTAVWEKTKAATVMKQIRLIKLIWEELKQGQILVWMKDKQLQQVIEQKEWGGRIKQKADNLVYVVESNLGANKANCCIERRMEINEQQLKLVWKNNNPFGNPDPPVSWGGNYYDYVRVVIPGNTVSVRVSVRGKELREATEEDFSIPNSLRRGRSEEMYVIDKRNEIEIVGFWVVVNAGEENTAEVLYEIPNNDKFAVQVVKQPGIGGLPLKITAGKELVFEGVMNERERIFTKN